MKQSAAKIIFEIKKAAHKGEAFKKNPNKKKNNQTNPEVIIYSRVMNCQKEAY